MVSLKELRVNRDFFRRIYNCRSTQHTRQVLNTATVTQLRSLLKLMKAVVTKKIPLRRRQHLTRLAAFKARLCKALDEFQAFLQQNRTQLLSYFCSVLSIVRLFVIPLFDFDVGDTPCGDSVDGAEQPEQSEQQQTVRHHYHQQQHHEQSQAVQGGGSQSLKERSTEVHPHPGSSYSPACSEPDVCTSGVMY